MVRLLSTACIVLLFSAWQTQEVTCNPIMELVDIVDQAYQIYQVIDQMTQPVVSADDQLTPVDVKIFSQFNAITRGQTVLANLIVESTENLDDKWTSKTAAFFETINAVNRTYSDFVAYAKNLKLISIEDMTNLAKDVKDPGFGSMADRVAAMHDTLTEKGLEFESLLDMISSKKSAELVCFRQQSPQQIISELYNILIATDLKALTLRLLATELENKKKKKKIETRNFLSKLELEKFTARVKKTHYEVVKHMAIASRELWRCDPPQNMKGQTYSKLQEVFQAFITNEEDNNLDTCAFSQCSEINEQGKRLSYQSNTHYSNLQPEKLRCSGYVVDCQSTGAFIEYCIAPEEDDRRYLGLHTTINDGDYSPNCQRHDHAQQVYSPWSNICMFCLCTCASNKLYIDRYFSLEPAKTDVSAGMVITGVRLKKVNHVFYIEIQEGHLGVNGTIESVRWNEIPKDKKVHFETIQHENPSNEYNDFPVNDKVYSVHWEQKTVFLDTFEIPDKNLVLTGLQFVQQDDALKLQVRLSPFDYETGEILDEGEWISNEAGEIERTRISLDNADDPLKKERYVIDSTTDQFLKFQVTNLESDMGQYTVPFLDLQPVITDPPTPLAGIGLYHKGVHTGDSGGFLGLKLIQYDYSKHLK